MNICLFVNLFYHLSIKYLLKTNLCVKIQFVNKPPPRRPPKPNIWYFLQAFARLQAEKVKKANMRIKIKNFLCILFHKNLCVCVCANSYLYAEQELNVVVFKSLRQAK